MRARHGGDPVAALSDRHDRVRAAMADLRLCPAAGQDLRGPEVRRRQAATTALRRAFVASQSLQQIALWPVLERRDPGCARTVGECVDRKRAIEEAMIKLDWRTTRDGAVNTYVAFVLDQTARLLEIEERQVRRFAQIASADDLAEVARRLAKAGRWLPTRPHPELPAAPALARLLSPAVTVADRLRDALASRVTAT